MKDSDLPDAVPLVTIALPGGDRLERLELVRVERLDPSSRAARRPAAARSESGISTVSAVRAASSALGNQAAVGAPGLDRPLPAGGGRDPGAGASHWRRARVGRSPPRGCPTIAAAVRSASSELRSCSRTISAPPATASAVAAAVAHSRSAGGGPILPGARQDGAEEVLAREGDEQRAAELAQLPEAPQDLEVVVDREVEVEARVQRDLLLGHAAGERRLDPLAEPALQVGDWIPVARGLPIDARRALDVHQHVAAASLCDQVEHLGVGAARDVVDRRRAGVQGAARDLDLEGVRGHRHAGAADQPLDRRDEPRGLLVGRHRRPAAGRHGADVEQVEPGLGQGQAVRDGALRGPAPRSLEERIVGDVDDPGRQRRRKLEQSAGDAPDGHPRLT